MFLNQSVVGKTRPAKVQIAPSTFRRHLVLVLVLLAAVFVSFAEPARAQTEQSDQDTLPISQEELSKLTDKAAVREMVSRLSDEQVRTLLLERLDAVAERSGEAAETATIAKDSFLETAFTGIYLPLVNEVRLFPQLWSRQVASYATFWDRLGATGLAQLFGGLALAIVVGLAAELAVRRFLSKRSATLSADVPRDADISLRGQLSFLAIRFFHEGIGLFVFYIVARSVSSLVVTEDTRPYFVVIASNLVLLPRIAAVASRFLLAPHRPEYRLVHTDDHTARKLFRLQIGLFFLVGLSLALVQFDRLNGMGAGQSELGYLAALAVHVYVVFLAWRCRDGLVLMMRGSEPTVTRAEATVARAYPWFVMAVSVGMVVVVNELIVFGQAERLRGGIHYWTMALLILAPAIDTMIRGLVRSLIRPMTGSGALAERAYMAAKRSYIRIGRALAFALVIFIIARLWSINPIHIGSAAGFGAQLASRLFEALLVFAAGYLVWEVVSLLVNRKLAAEQTAAGSDGAAHEPAEGEGGAGGSRLSTVLPLILVTLRIAIATVFLLIALSSLGIDTTPLLAGAGVAGLAIGFGAQKLVTDVVSGVFFLVDDAFRVGEYVEVDGTMGTVEKISIRSMQLRHHRGPVHTIPYGEIPKLTNYSRDWVIMKLKFTVPFDTDPNKVKKVFKKIGQEMSQDPMFKDDFLQPFKSQGVLDFDDRGMVVRGKFMAKPGTQFTLRKEIYTRVKQSFDEAGIPFARREVKVAIEGIDDASDLSEEQKKNIAAAAADAVDQQTQAGST